MSAERQRDESTSGPDDGASPRRTARSIPSLDGHRLETVSTHAVGKAANRRRPAPLSARIERARLEVRIAALERALERSERRRQVVIDRYERLLDDQTTADGDRTSTDDRSRSLLQRLLED